MSRGRRRLDRVSERTTPAPSEAVEVPVGGPLARPWRWLSLGMFALIFLAAFEVLAVTTVMPLVAADLDGEHLYALAFSVPLAAGVVGMVVVVHAGPSSVAMVARGPDGVQRRGRAALRPGAMSARRGNGAGGPVSPRR